MISLGLSWTGCKKENTLPYTKQINALEQQIAIQNKRFKSALEIKSERLEEIRKETEAAKEEIPELKELLALKKTEHQKLLQEIEERQPLGKPFDVVTLGNNKTVSCSVNTLSESILELLDADGKTMAGRLSSIKNIDFRSSDVADSFPQKSKPAEKQIIQAEVPDEKETESFKLEPRLLDLYVVRSKSAKKANNRSGFIHEKLQNIQYRGHLAGRLLPHEIPGVKVVIYVFGEDVENKNNFKILIKEQLEFTLPHMEKATFETKEVENFFDKRGGGQYGHEHYGYFAVLISPEGEEILTKATSKKLEQAYTEFKDLNEGAIFRL